MEVIILKRLDDQYDSVDIYTGKTTPVLNAYLKEYEQENVLHPIRTYTFEQEARLKEDGSPYIYSWTVDTTTPTYEEWCLKGKDHHKELETEYGSTRWKYTRTLIKYCWVIEFNTLEEVSEFLIKYDTELTHHNFTNPLTIWFVALTEDDLPYD